MKLKQKIISILSATACTVSLCIGSVSISAETKSDLKKYDDYLSYRQVDKNDDGTFDYIEISECDKSAEKITIPDKIDNLPVTSIRSWAFKGCTCLESVDIPESVTSIGNYAFYCCTNLTNIKLPDSVTSIGNDAFAFCTILMNINIPESLKTIEDLTFFGCDCLGGIDIPKNVTSIADSAFDGCSRLTDINVSSDNEFYSSINGILFNKDKTEFISCPPNKKADKYSIPDSITAINDKAFEGCTKLKNIIIPNSVTSIGNESFKGCTSMNSIEISDSVTSIGSAVFSQCVSLESINISPDNKNYCSINGVLFNKNKTKLIEYPKGRKNAEYSIPNGVISIGAYAFMGCANLTAAEIPESVMEIDSEAFRDCKSLMSTAIHNPDCEIYDNEFTINKGIIYGDVNSSAQTYANKYGYKFESLDELHIKGDANNDGKFNIRDAAFISIACAKGLYDDIPIWADYNDDGKRNIRDAAAIAIYLATR